MVCQGIKGKIEYDRKGQCALAELKIEDAASGLQECKRMSGNLANGTCDGGTTSKLPTQPTATEDFEEELQQAWGDVSGRELDAGKVRKTSGGKVVDIHNTSRYTKLPGSKALQL